METDNQHLTDDQQQEALSGYRQAIKYGQDLARIYQAEKARRQELEAAHELTSAILASTPDSLIVIDEDFIIREVNPAFERLVERKTDGLIGESLATILKSEDLLEALYSLDESSHNTLSVEFILSHPVKRSMLARIARLESQQSRGWVISLYDQSERKRLDYQKIEFINIAAHELRTPLSSILGFATLLADTPPEGETERAELARLVVNSSHQLKEIINELLTFTQVSQGDLRTYNVVDFDPAELIEDVVSDLEAHALQRRVSVRSRLAPDMCRIMANEAMVRSAIYQLVLNAINFNRPGGWAQVTGEIDGDALLIEVSDSGIGIPQTEIEQIFLPFFQVEDHNVRRVGGLGLGLSIVRNMADQLGGDVSVQSVLGEGSTFTLRLPFNQPE